MWTDGQWITKNYGLLGGYVDATVQIRDGAKRLNTAEELHKRGIAPPSELGVVTERGTGPGRHPWFFTQSDN